MKTFMKSFSKVTKGFGFITIGVALTLFIQYHTLANSTLWTLVVVSLLLIIFSHLTYKDIVTEEA